MRTRGLLVGLALGVVAAAPLLARRPARGVTLRLEAAGPDEAGPGAGPWVVAWFTNEGSGPAPLCWSDPAGEELALEVTPALDRARGPEVATVATSNPIRRTLLPPGGRLGVRCDLSRWFVFPGPGVYEVRAARAPWGDPVGGLDGVRAESPPLRLDVR